MHVVFLAWMDRNFGRRQSEDNPAVAHIHVRQLKHILQESPIRLRVSAVNDRVSANNHAVNCRRFRPAQLPLTIVAQRVSFLHDWPNPLTLSDSGETRRRANILYNSACVYGIVKKK